ncbi:MAG: hypothetical protein ABEJ22_02400 [Haloferacaceae archaeon]
MGLRCLLGHDFGEPELESERREDGDEMIVTVKEVKTCERCGERRVVSKSKEVSSIREPEEVGLDADGVGSAVAPDADETATADDESAGEAVDVDADEPDGESPAAGAGSTGAGADVVEEDAEILDGDDEPAVGGGAADSEAEAADAAATADASDETDEATDETDEATGETDEARPDEEDAEILDGDADLIDEAEADPGDGSASGGADGDADAETASDAEGDEAVDDDGVILDEEASQERGHGEWPDPDDNRQTVEEDDGPSLEDVGGDMEIEEDPDDVDTSGVEYDAEFIDADDAGGDAGVREWPEQEGADEGFAAELDDDETTDVSFGGGLTPEASGEARTNGEDATYVGSDSGEFVRAQNPPLDRHGEPGAVTEFYCPNCGESQPAGKSSMRAGDICPECRRGYIAERDATGEAQ